MQQWTTQFEWSFPGGLPGVLLAVAVAAALAILSYRFTPRVTGRRAKAALIFIRLLFFSLLLFCLCRPSITRKLSIRGNQKQNVAVLIDESSSMRQKTLLDTSRFEKAKTYWLRHLDKYADQYTFHLYQFGKEIRPVQEFELQTPAPLTETDLYPNITRWNKMFPAQEINAVICMTDGIDTSGTPLDEAMNTLSHTPLPHVFIPITTAILEPPFSAFRKVEVASAAKTHTRVPITIVTSSSGGVPGEKGFLTVHDENTEIYRAKIAPIKNNFSTQMHRFELAIESPGMHRYTAQIIKGATSVAQTEWSIQGTENARTKVLLYQGGLDWGTRYIRNVFDRDSRTELTVNFAPSAFPVNMVAKKNETRFPAIDTLAAYDVIVILKMKREQIEDEMNDVLREFVSSGGSLLFIIANTLDAQAYIGSPLEAFLPVEFESIQNSPSSYDAETERFLKTMQSYRNSKPVALDRLKEPALDAPPLHPFKLTEEGRKSPLFSYLDDPAIKNSKLPEFQDFALIRNRKPGARVLAVHPDLSTPDSERILMAQQTFGKGHVAVLATDPLWRWKLTTDSSNPSYDKFWTSLFAWLGAGNRHASYWERPSQGLMPGTPVDCTFHLVLPSGPSTFPVKATLTDLTTRKTIELPLTAAGEQPALYNASFTPAPETTYQLQALLGETLLAEAILSCPPAAGHMELQELRPNINVLRCLTAASPQHTLVQIDQPYDWASWLPDQLNEKDLIKSEYPLWHKPWIFILMLALYLGELLLRRRYKLV